MQRKGELGTAQTARLLEVHPKTLRNWARRAVEGAELTPPPLEMVRRDLTGRYWFDRDEVLTLRGLSSARDPADVL